MRADTVRNGWKPAAKADREAAVEAGSVEPRKRATAKRAAAKKTTAPKAANSDTATAGANDTETE